MSIRVKLVLIYIALVFLVMIGAGTFIMHSIRINEERNMRFILTDWAAEVNTNVIDAAFMVPNFHITDGQEAFEALFTQSFLDLIANRLPTDMEAFIISTYDGRTLQASVASPTINLDYIFASVIISAMVGQESFSAGANHISDQGFMEPWFELAVPVYLPYFSYNYDPIYIIYVRQRAAGFNESLAQTGRIIATASMMALAAAFLFGVLFSNSITANILKLNRHIKDFNPSMQIKNLEHVNVVSKDEIGQLSASFNSMADKLYQTMLEITNEKNKIEIVMHNMTDGVLAYDNNGKLIHFNYICSDMLNIKHIASLDMQHMLSIIGVDIPKTKENRIDFEKLMDTTISRGEKYISTSFNPYKNEFGYIEGIIVVCQDITKHMKLDNMRKEFVANVSHEIRTPLTTIKGYAETLLDGAYKEDELCQSFLGVINNEADRMAAIVRDLLQLSHFDNKQMELALKPTNLAKLIDDNVKANSVLTEKEGGRIIFNTEVHDAIINIDPERINQVLNNIITNSFRYSGKPNKDESFKENYVNIEIDLRQSAKSYMIYITDNGIGIPKEELRLIFERFYRVDKARSRELGGTGLGLSIAKEIMAAHGGKIHVSSELGKGTTMMLRFQKSNPLKNDTQ